jgi:hypothetical protein
MEETLLLVIEYTWPTTKLARNKYNNNNNNNNNNLILIY